MQKRKSAYMRFGRSAPSFDDGFKRPARKSAFGKRSSGLEEMMPVELDDGFMRQTRKSAYMRFGKRSAPVEPMDFIPVDLDAAYVMEKRKPAALRFG
ncbi:hypothetical protein M3Y99_01578900 [Aphelenchoides fujianensis]|nr:hypothetical protein M3Y99_01578900 [Aphelenchoides fujianensis]